jgi:hypothetical protein
MILRRDKSSSRRVSRSLSGRSEKFQEIDALVANVLVRGNPVKATSILDYELLIEKFRQLEDDKVDLVLEKKNYYARVLSDILSTESDPLQVLTRDGNLQLVWKRDFGKFLQIITL